jgi:hypothetical protein
MTHTNLYRFFVLAIATLTAFAFAARPAQGANTYTETFSVPSIPHSGLLIRADTVRPSQWKTGNW